MNKAILHCAVGLLSRREHSYKELKNKLCLREFDSDDIPDVLDHLIEKNYLSDERFAESLCRLRVNKGYGWRFIKSELAQKGVSSAIIYNLSKNQQIDWYLQAELAYNKRFGETEPVDQKDKMKRVRFLQYRGYSHEEIMALVN